MSPVYRCPCGATFPEALGKYGCPNCCGENVAELEDDEDLDNPPVSDDPNPTV